MKITADDFLSGMKFEKKEAGLSDETVDMLRNLEALATLVNRLAWQNFEKTDVFDSLQDANENIHEAMRLLKE